MRVSRIEFTFPLVLVIFQLATPVRAGNPVPSSGEALKDLMRHVYLFCATVLFLACSQRSTNTAVSPALPRPSGQFSIGREDFDWVDESRPEPLSTLPGAHRELLVSLWYPTKANQPSGAHAPYYEGASIINKSPESKTLRDSYGKAWPFILNGALQTHALENAPLAQTARGRPVLVFSHGYGVSGSEYTALTEHLVSHGFIVAVIVHTFESAPVLLSENRVAGMSPLSTSHYAPPEPGTSYE